MEDSPPTYDSIYQVCNYTSTSKRFHCKNASIRDGLCIRHLQEQELQSDLIRYINENFIEETVTCKGYKKKRYFFKKGSYFVQDRK